MMKLMGRKKGKKRQIYARKANSINTGFSCLVRFGKMLIAVSQWCTNVILTDMVKSDANIR
jgi:transcription elongation factor Elf1